MSIIGKVGKFVALQVLGNASDSIGHHIGDGIGRRLKRVIDPLGAFYEEIRMRHMVAEMQQDQDDDEEESDEADVIEDEDEDGESDA